MTWTNPEAVTISGYSGSEQDPSITPAWAPGLILFDNHTDVPGASFQIFYATLNTYKTATLAGQPIGVNFANTTQNNPVLDVNGNFYFNTGEFYPSTLDSVYQGRWQPGGLITSIGPTFGISPQLSGWLTLQVSLSADGNTLLYSNSNLPLVGPNTGIATIGEATRNRGFTPNPNNATIYANVNATSRVVYNAYFSSDMLTIFFTAAFDFANGPHMYFATRPNTASAFGVPTLIVAAGDMVENGSLSLDGTHLYYHRLLGPQNVNSQIYVLTGP